MQSSIRHGVARATEMVALANPAPAIAQQSAFGPGDSSERGEDTVIDIRLSLQRSLDLKRQATGVVDVIPSEDIGKFPGSNLAASLAGRRSSKEHRGARLRAT